MSELYFDREFATVEYKPGKNLVVARMTGYAEGKEFRDYQNGIIDAVRDTGCPDVLADTREMPPLAQQDQRWSAETWGPKAEASGVERIAGLAPESVVSKMSMESITDEAESFDDIERAYFEEYEEAVSWLNGS